MEPVPNSQNVPIERVLRAILRALWFVVVPALGAGVAVRYLVPTPVETTGTWAEVLARWADEHALAVGTAFFLGFAIVVRYWCFRLPSVRWFLTGRAPAEIAPQANRWKIYARLASWVAAAIALALFVRTSFVGSYQVLSASMLPTLEPGDVIAVNKLAYGLRLPLVRHTLGARFPRRGDIVIFRNPVAGAQPEHIVKRIIGLPGDRITMEGNLPVINGWKVPVCDAGRYLYAHHKAVAHAHLFVEFLEDRAHLSLYGLGTRPFPGIYEVPAEHVFVLGDDRNNSSDSRAWNDGRGAGLPMAAIEGRAVRQLTRRRRDERTDFSPFLRPFGLRPHLESMDARPLEQGIDECLRRRPAETYPPAPSETNMAGATSEQARSPNGG
ncbi:MAG TPA: signal peptidase I [Polyangiaceae bacterium]